ncbi:unnamed protein product [Rotaria sp. Silwood2]|nr:unnamed protein product [Rotaria sp. Silwood2]CAF2865769.1 unnamed protein product [Rotaria sp. Silwood2]CAF3126592.1 unnamed protein product [Rotaria sp. Silwood2]CAF3279963.1 unnamed protein product [Rotaria sp. Silwood2]CAF3920949.1 unnamed protein product [Rotaria sp. Silwood2]
MNKGGKATQTLTVDQIPAHQHSKGTLNTASAGIHSHAISDRGHNHGGQIDERRGGAGGWNLKGNGAGPFDDWAVHTYTIPMGTTEIWLSADGSHSHLIDDSISSTGTGEPLSIIPPYQSIHYIIFTGD